MMNSLISGAIHPMKPRPSRSSCSCVEDRSSGFMPKAAGWLAKNRNGNYWWSTKQTSMVIQGLTDYLVLSGELSNSSDVEVLVNGASAGKRHFGPGDGFALPWRVTIPATQVGSTAARSLSAKAATESLTGRRKTRGTLPTRNSISRRSSRSISPATTTCSRRISPSPPTPSPTTWFRSRARSTWAILSPSSWRSTAPSWKYLLAEDPIPAGTEFLPNTGLYTLNNKPDWWADWFTRKEFHDDRAAFFNTDFSGRREYVYLLKVVNPGKFAISPAQAGPMYQSNVQATTDPATLEVQP